MLKQTVSGTLTVPIEKFEFTECKGLLKVLLSTRCKYDCVYCPNPWQRGSEIQPEKLASYIVKKNIRKVFISSAVSHNTEVVMDNIENAGRLIRDKVDYLHLKIMPHSNKDSIERVVEIADRVSLNFESPRKDILAELSSFKDFRDFVRQQKIVARTARNYGKSFTTQIIVGLGETDYDALRFAEKMYELGAARVYYSRFTPIKGTPLEDHPPEIKSRIIRLYRADALVRLYGVSVRKLRQIMIDDFLPRKDPKVMLAERFGIKKIEDLPGVGIKTVKLLRSGKRLVELRNSGVKATKLSVFADGQRTLNDYVQY